MLKLQELGQTYKDKKRVIIQSKQNYTLYTAMKIRLYRSSLTREV